jgi:NAD(P)-dependent dehydrogenase (short-subunit alcohol dehydrogenase family)
MGDRLKGKVAIVTGGGRGIGRAEAIALAAEGAKVVVNDLGVGLDGLGDMDRSPADEVVAEIKQAGGGAAANYDTVATSAGADSIIKTALDTFGRLDILVNNAGIGGLVMEARIWEMSDELWDRMVQVHLYGAFYTTRAACRVFKEQRSGRIILTSSPGGRGLAGACHYSAGKEGTVGLMRTVAKEMSEFNVTCNALRPAASTRMSRSGKLKITNLAEIPSADIAPLVVYLATDEAQGVSGRVFRNIGGLIELEKAQYIKSIYTEGHWTVDQLVSIFPGTLGLGLETPTPESPPL